MTSEQIAWQLRRHLTTVVPGVYRANRGPMSDEERQLAALLLGGPRSVLSGLHATRFYGIAATEKVGRIDVLIPVNQAPRTLDWIRLRRSSLVDPGCRAVAGIRWVSPARAVAEAALWSTSPRLTRKIVIEAAQRSVAHPDDVAAWVERLGRRHTVCVSAAVAEARTHVWSVPEADLAALVARSTILPEAWANPSLRRGNGDRLITPGLWFDDVAMAVMVHSRAHHSGPEEWERTVSRDAELQALGVVSLGVTPAAIRDEPAAVLRRIEEAYTNARGSGRHRPDVIATPRS